MPPIPLDEEIKLQPLALVCWMFSLVPNRRQVANRCVKKQYYKKIGRKILFEHFRIANAQEVMLDQHKRQLIQAPLRAFPMPGAGVSAMTVLTGVQHTGKTCLSP